LGALEIGQTPKNFTTPNRPFLRRQVKCVTAIEFDAVGLLCITATNTTSDGRGAIITVFSRGKLNFYLHP